MRLQHVEIKACKGSGGIELLDLHLCPLAAALVLIALGVGAVHAEEPVRGTEPKPAPTAPPSNDKPAELKGISCTHGVACPIIGVAIPDVPLDPVKPAEPRR